MSDYRVENSKSYDEYQKSFKSSNEPLSQVDYLELKVKKLQKNYDFLILMSIIVASVAYILFIATKATDE